jgi:hypothetical protein
LLGSKGKERKGMAASASHGAGAMEHIGWIASFGYGHKVANPGCPHKSTLEILSMIGTSSHSLYNKFNNTGYRLYDITISHVDY